MEIGKVRKKIAAVLTALFAVSAFGCVANASPVLDQENPPTTNYLNDSLKWQQQVTDGITGTLSGVELFTVDASATLTVKIGLGSAFYSGPFAFSTSVLVTSAGTFIDTSSAGISLTAGEHFVIDVSGGADVADLLGSRTVYSGGDLFLKTGSAEDFSAENGAYLAFETFITPPAGPSGAPEPITLSIFGAGLAGATAMRRRKAKRA